MDGHRKPASAPPRHCVLHQLDLPDMTRAHWRGVLRADGQCVAMLGTQTMFRASSHFRSVLPARFDERDCFIRG